jgi:hypothetical protein
MTKVAAAMPRPRGSRTLKIVLVDRRSSRASRDGGNSALPGTHAWRSTLRRTRGSFTARPSAGSRARHCASHVSD